jgi:Protein of unknown function (DUF4199)
MKKISITYGIISGVIVSLFMITSSIMLTQYPDMKISEIIGFVGMIIAFLFIFFGIMKYRDTENNGSVSFIEALKIGLIIATIASLFYVVVWLIEYYFFFPDFMDKFAEMSLQKMKTSGSTAAEIAAKTTELNTYKEYYKSPIMIVLLTLMEIFPLGLVVALVSALILKRNKQNDNIML